MPRKPSRPNHATTAARCVKRIAELGRACAVWNLDGDVVVTDQRSLRYGRLMRLHANCLVGVYTPAATAEMVADDLRAMAG